MLAERLRMTVAEMRERMSAAEWMAWTVYLGREAQRRQLSGR